ncbi:hypothetical protein [Streptomyces globisporus]|uniref:hypothetical protein n=1 Tax=Streptomyces globisporus TaxID=1908 RepID=UPI0036CA8743
MSVQAPTALFEQDAAHRAVDTVLTDFLAIRTHSSTLDQRCKSALTILNNPNPPALITAVRRSLAVSATSRTT